MVAKLPSSKYRKCRFPILKLGSNVQLDVKFFAYSKLLLDLVFSSTHSTVTEMNPVNCVSLTVFYQSYQCNFYRPTETDSENFFSFHSFKNSWIN